MILYHGSDKIIKKPLYGIGNPHNDYGLGFYCTEDHNLAKEWACPASRDGFANKYNLDMNRLQMLDLQDSNYHILNWLALLLKNRIFAKKTPIAMNAERYILNEFLPDTNGYDIICGYRADDSYFAYAKDFLNNALSLSGLERAMHLGDLGSQVVLISECAFHAIEYIGYETADSKIYYARRRKREECARAQYLDHHGIPMQNLENEIFVMDLIRNGVKNHDECLFRTFCE